MIDRALIRG